MFHDCLNFPNCIRFDSHSGAESCLGRRWLVQRRATPVADAPPGRRGLRKQARELCGEGVRSEGTGPGPLAAVRALEAALGEEHAPQGVVLLEGIDAKGD